MRVFLIGFMGSGKTTIGKRLAPHVGFRFVDTDQNIEQQYGQKVGEIFAAQGEIAFREMERETLNCMIQQDNVIVSTGGGMPCYKDNMDIMLANGKVVYLKTSSESLTNRLLHSKTERPLIRDKSQEELQQYIEEKLAERTSFYKQAHITIQTENFSLEQLLQSLNLTGS